MSVTLRSRRFLTAPFVVCAVAVVLLAAGCRKKPPEVDSTPTAPAVEPVTPPETVRDRPLPPVTEEEPRPVTSSADEWNRKGVLKSIYFDFDRHEVRPDQRPTLQENARWLNGDLSSFRVVIEGHCDERGTNEYNMALGDRRANATRQYLIQLGVPASRIRVISYGEERPADPGHNESAWAKNRRAAFVVEEG